MFTLVTAAVEVKKLICVMNYMNTVSVMANIIFTVLLCSTVGLNIL